MAIQIGRIPLESFHHVSLCSRPGPSVNRGTQTGLQCTKNWAISVSCNGPKSVPHERVLIARHGDVQRRSRIAGNDNLPKEPDYHAWIAKTISLYSGDGTGDDLGRFNWNLTSPKKL